MSCLVRLVARLRCRALEIDVACQVEGKRVVEDDGRLFTAYRVADGIVKDEFVSPPDLAHFFRVVEFSRRTSVEAGIAERDLENRSS